MTSKFLRATGLVLASGALVATLGACSSSGSTGSGTTTDSGSSTSASPTSTEPVATIAALTGKTTSVALSTNFTGALKTLGLTPGVTGTAQLANGSLIFPITGGNVTVYTPGTHNPYVTGSIKHDGSGITLTGGATVVGLSNFTIDPGGSKLFGDVTANGAAVGSQLYLFNLDGSTLQPLQADAAAGTATLTGTTVYISPDAAALLNKTFSTTAVTDKLDVGIATIVVNTK